MANVRANIPTIRAMLQRNLSALILLDFAFESNWTDHWRSTDDNLKKKIKTISLSASLAELSRKTKNENFQKIQPVFYPQCHISESKSSIFSTFYKFSIKS